MNLVVELVEVAEVVEVVEADAVAVVVVVVVEEQGLRLQVQWPIPKLGLSSRKYFFNHFSPPTPHSGVLRGGGQPKWVYFINLLIMSSKTWPFKNFFGRSLYKLFQCYVKNFDRKPAISLKTLKIGFFQLAPLPKSSFFECYRRP